MHIAGARQPLELLIIWRVRGTKDPGQWCRQPADFRA